MQYLTPSSRKRSRTSLIFASEYIALPALHEIGMIERRCLLQPAPDQRAQIFHHPLEPKPAFVGTGTARATGCAICARPVDGMREDQAFGAVGIVGIPYQILAHQFRCDREHQRGFRVIGVPVVAVRKMRLTDSW